MINDPGSSNDNETARYLDRVAQLIRDTPREPLYRIAHQIYTRYQLGALIVSCGNGGSAATASHLACDLTKATRHDGRAPLRAVCLNDSAASATAWANDTSYTQALMEQSRSVARPGDVLICISGSGNSPNVIAAAIDAKTRRILVLALTGSGGGDLARIADLAVVVPSREMPAIEDVHLALCHALTNSLRTWVAS